MINDMTVLDYIKLNKHSSTIELAKELGASESTVRRALTRLEDKRLIMRFHGGAQIIEAGISADDVAYRKGKNWKKKNVIAREASKVVEDNSTIILLGGTTVCAMCNYIRNKKLTVITNSLIVLDELKREEHIKIILLGGEYNPIEKELGGAITSFGMKHMRADYLFSGATSFDEKQGATTQDLYSLELYRSCIESSNQIYILTDSSKFEKFGTAVTAYHHEITCLITDSDIDSDLKERLAEKGLNVKVVSENKI